jgi:hypothetical protein
MNTAGSLGARAWGGAIDRLEVTILLLVMQVDEPVKVVKQERLTDPRTWPKYQTSLKEVPLLEQPM